MRGSVNGGSTKKLFSVLVKGFSSITVKIFTPKMQAVNYH